MPWSRAARSSLVSRSCNGRSGSGWREPRAHALDRLHPRLCSSELLTAVHGGEATQGPALQVGDRRGEPHQVRNHRRDRLRDRRSRRSSAGGLGAETSDFLADGSPHRARYRHLHDRPRPAPGPDPPTRTRAGDHARLLGAEARRRVHRERHRDRRRRADRRGAHLQGPWLLAARPLREVGCDRLDRPRLRPRARPRRSASVPHRVRNRPRLSTQQGEKRLPRHDRSRPLQRGCAHRFGCGKTTGGYPPRVRCGLVCALALLILFPAATGAAPLASIQTTPAAGPAPLRVTFAAAGGAASDHWDFGDGTGADGQTVEHTYAAGRWTATLTSRSADGTTQTATTSVTAYGLTLTAPNPARYGRKVVLRGAIVPGERNLAVEIAGPRGRIATTRTRADGTYLVRARIRAPGSYTATSERAAAVPLALRVVPKL